MNIHLVPELPSTCIAICVHETLMDSHVLYNGVTFVELHEYESWGKVPERVASEPRVQTKLTRFDPRTLGWEPTTQTIQR